MKYVIKGIISLAIIGHGIIYAQTSPADLDKSPMDMSYFPTNYPIQKIQGKGGATPIARIVYSRPQKKGRIVFGGELVKYDEVWRLGANEATEIEFYQNVKIGGKKVYKGRYTVYCIPKPTVWTLILNKEVDAWGAFNYNTKKDILRIDLPVQIQASNVEALTMYFEAVTGGANLIMLWDNVKVFLPINI